MAAKTSVFTAILFYGYILQNLSHSVNSASDGIRKSPRGERLTEPTLGAVRQARALKLAYEKPFDKKPEPLFELLL